jgi:uncharacterized protein YaeQ
MALKATIFKAELQISDMDRNYYHTHMLTLARHPSENDERMMVRLLAFAQHAQASLQFTKGLSTQDEPDLWLRDLSGNIELWIEIGQPDEKRIRKACGRAVQVVIYTYSGNSADIWWQQNCNRLKLLPNLTVMNLATSNSQELAALAQRTMRLQCTIQDGDTWLGNEQGAVQVTLVAR